MIKTNILLSSALVGTLFAFPQLAMAQAAPAAEQPQAGGLEDIVVTARKTEESLQTTPVAVTAITAAGLTQAQVKDVSDLQRTAPSLVIAKGTAGASSMAIVAIRGQGNLQPILANDPAVATYIDGVYVARPSVGLTDLQDIQRLEVLRGPQGTLFGRNTTGGAVNIISKDPTHDLEGTLRGEVGNYGYKNAAVTLNVPLTDSLAARINYSYRDRDGYGVSRTTGDDIGNVKSHFVRGKLKYDGNGWDVTLSGDYNNMKDTGQNIQLLAVNPGIITAANPFQPAMIAALHNDANFYDNYANGISTPAGAAYLALPADIREKYYGKTPFNQLEVYGFSGTVNVELGSMNLKSITSWRRSKNDGLNDTDTSAAPVLATFSGSHSNYYSQELQLSGDITDALSFITGAYYGHEKGFEYSRSQIFAGLIRDSDADIVNKTFGAYAQAYYQITDTLRAVGGFRYTWDTRNSVLHNAQVLGLPYNAAVAGTPTGINCTVTAPDTPVTADTCNQTQDAKFSYPAWTAGIDWQATPDLFLYAKTSGAAKAGGWNLRAGGLPAFNPEKVKDVELGVKADLFDRHVRINTAVFNTWKTGNQAVVNSFVPGIGVTQYIQNNGDARIWGVESEITVLPWKGMELGGNVSLLDGKYKAGSYTETQVIAGSGCTNSAGVVNGCVVDLSTTNLIQLPKVQINLSAKQSVEVGDGTFSVQGSWSYIGKQYFDQVKAADQQPDAVKAQYAAENALGKIKGYGLFNARVAYHLNSPDIELAAFMRNVTNKKYITRSFADLYRQIGFADEYAGEPRTWGMMLTYNF